MIARKPAVPRGIKWAVYLLAVSASLAQD